MNCQSHQNLECGTTRSRRWFLTQCGVGLGRIGLATLLADLGAQQPAAADDAAEPFQPKSPHFVGKARAVIHLFMAGAPSQLDLFDFKPELVKYDGKPLPPSIIGDQRYAFIRPDAAVMAPRFKFSRHGACGMELSEILPLLAGIEIGRAHV